MAKLPVQLFDRPTPYRVRVDKRAGVELEALPFAVSSVAVAILETFAWSGAVLIEGKAGGIKALRGRLEGFYRIRFLDSWRIVLKVSRPARTIHVIRVRDRASAYQ